MPDVRIRLAEPHDAEVLADLAARSFRDTFADVNTAEDLRLHIDRSFSRELQASEIANSEIRTLVAEVEGMPAGFAQVCLAPAPECVSEPLPVQLWRFYVDAPWIGRGVAKPLIAAVCAEALALGGLTAWLGVWERNDRAIAFYLKCGFLDVGSHAFLLGEDRQTDRIMVRRLTAG